MSAVRTSHRQRVESSMMPLATVVLARRLRLRSAAAVLRSRTAAGDNLRRRVARPSSEREPAHALHVEIPLSGSRFQPRGDAPARDCALR
jgi:hypothetical protein